jgi:hypothetical protein
VIIDCPSCCGDLVLEIPMETTASGIEPLKLSICCECGQTVPVEVRVGKTHKTTLRERRRLQRELALGGE